LDVQNAFLAANDLVVSGNILPLEILNKITSSATGVTLGRYNRRELLADLSGFRLDTTDEGVSQRALSWMDQNPLNIFGNMGRSFSNLARRVSAESKASLSKKQP
jgi:hypothetical protein